MANDETTRLVLHFDVNETILVSDPAGGDTFEDSKNKMIAKSAFCQIPETDGTASGGTGFAAQYWYDGTPIAPDVAPPPLHFGWEWPENSIPYYRLDKKCGSTFTLPLNPGSCYAPVAAQIERALRWQQKEEGGNTICNSAEKLINGPDPRLIHDDGVHYFLLPAFFHTIKTLAARGREFTVVIRTFGNDMAQVCAALTAFAEAENLPEFAIEPTRAFEGRYDPATGQFVLKREGETIVSEDEVVDALELVGQGPRAIACCQDDYHYWRQHHCEPSYGKPVWLTRLRSSSAQRSDDAAAANPTSTNGADASVHCHHIFFDDNIHNLEHDSIVAVRARNHRGEQFTALSGKDTLAEHGVHIVRVPTVEPILNIDWFLEKIDECEANFAKREHDQEQHRKPS